MFKFSFEGLDNSIGNDTKDEAKRDGPIVDDGPGGQRVDPPACRLIEVSSTLVKQAPDAFDVVEIAGDLTLRKSITTVPKSLSSNGADVVPGVYEGGYKLWECAVDLVRYQHKTKSSFIEKGTGISALEIGAGHALPAIWCIQAGVARVTIHDFNELVLRECTAVNVALNCTSDASEKVEYISGDWGGISLATREKGGFDVILSAETVYSKSSLESLARSTLTLLKPNGGYALFAGKSYYFGVGGGMNSFRNMVDKVAKSLSIAVGIDSVEQLRDGKSNVREICRITRL